MAAAIFLGFVPVYLRPSPSFTLTETKLTFGSRFVPAPAAPEGPKGRGEADFRRALNSKKGT